MEYRSPFQRIQTIESRLLPLFFSLILFCIMQGVLAGGEPSNTEDKEIVSTRASIFENGKYITIQTGGSPNMVTVFEVLSDKSLRKLHIQKLVNKGSPSALDLCYGGRFLISTDEWFFDFQDAEESLFALVVYDLLRKEHTSYRLSDFLSAEMLSKLNDDGLTGKRWHVGPGLAGDKFNSETLEFYVSSPTEFKLPRLDPEPIPFVIVDLRKRSVRVATSVPELKPVIPNAVKFRVSYLRERENDLPQYLRIRAFSNDIEEGCWVYSLNTDSGEYAESSIIEWSQEEEKQLRPANETQGY